MSSGGRVLTEQQQPETGRMTSPRNFPTQAYLTPARRYLTLRCMKYSPDCDYRANIRAAIGRASPEALAFGLAWYSVAGELAAAIGARTGYSAEVVAGVLSALSPRNKWARNVADAAAFCEAAQAGGEMPSACTFGANRRKAWRILGERQVANVLRGRKVESFIANILGDYLRVTVDVWAVRAATAGARDAVKGDSDYRAIEAAYIEVAAEVGMAPAQAQAVAWCSVNPKAVQHVAR